MKALKVLEMKDFMSKLFTGNVFDNFLVKEVKIRTFCETVMDGKRIAEFYDSEELIDGSKTEYALWSELKPFAYQLIKGNKLPISMSFIMMLSNENMYKMLEKAGLKINESENARCVLNIRYENAECKILTATARSSFSLDKSLEQEWDRTMGIFLKHFSIPTENC